MDHVAGSGNAVKPALGEVEVQSCRLRINVDQSVFITCDDDDGIFKFAYSHLDYADTSFAYDADRRKGEDGTTNKEKINKD